VSDDGFTIDPDHLESSGGKLEQFGTKLDQGGSKMEQAGHRLATHAGRDKSGIGKVLVEGFGKGTEIAGEVIKEGGRVIKKSGQHLKGTGRTHRAHDERSKKRFRDITDGEEQTTKPKRPRKDPNRPADADELRENRPSYRKSTRFGAFKGAQRDANGDIICPNSGERIPVKRDKNGKPLLFNEKGQPDPNGFTVPLDNPPSGKGDAVYHMGHVSDSEYRRLVQMVEDNPGRWTHSEILDEYNDPAHYQIEHPATNIGHQHESTTPGYGHYGHMANQPQPSSSDGQTAGTGPQERPPRIKRRR
jgi:hypothetical protein